MIFSKIWERYIFKEFIRFFAFFLFGFYFLYVVIDYSIHCQDFLAGKNLGIWKLIQYYLFQFFKRADILLPLATMIASIKVLYQLNVGKELLALQSAGIKQKLLLRPLFVVAFLCCFLNFSINEYLVPHSLNFIDKFYDSHLRHSFRGNRNDPLRLIQLEDHSKLLYQSYNAAKEAFFDVIWMKSNDEIYRMRYLSTNPQKPVGEFVDHLVRKEEGFEKVESFISGPIPGLKWDPNLPRKGFIPYENWSMSDLYHTWKHDPFISNFEKQGLLSHFLFKTLMPLLNLFVLIGVAPFCIRYSRSLSPFVIYALALFGFVGFIALMDAVLILGENAAISPNVALVTPFAALLIFFSWRFQKT